MIELFLNEKSLAGQFSTVEDFSDHGITGLIAVLNDQKILMTPTVLYKSETISSAMVTQTETYSEVIFKEEYRYLDGIRRYKKELMNLMDNPFWNSESQQKTQDQYMSMEGYSLKDTSVAEAEARNGILVSFLHPAYQQDEIRMKKNTTDVYVRNIWQEGQLLEASYQKCFVKFQEYATVKLSGQKLDFSMSAADKVWNCIPAEIEDIVFKAFKKFCDTSWQDIPNDQGLGYKPYHKTRTNEHFFDSDEWNKGIKEFRITGKSRCFGYQDKGRFFLLMVDLGHILGNR